MTPRLRAHTLIATLCALGGVSLPSPRQVDPEPCLAPAPVVEPLWAFPVTVARWALTTTTKHG